MSNIVYEYQDVQGAMLYPLSFVSRLNYNDDLKAYTLTPFYQGTMYKLVKVIKTGATIEGYDGIKITYILEGVK
jgi:hypothetical protein